LNQEKEAQYEDSIPFIIEQTELFYL
jgi:hypothetical protein